MTYLGQFYKKYGGTTLRPMLKRTNTSPVLMSEEKKKELDRLASVKERYANKRSTYSRLICCVVVPRRELL